VSDADRVVVLFSGGGTGGHLYPALALAEALVGIRPDVRPVFVGAQRGVEARVLPARGVEHVLLPVRGAGRNERGAALRALASFARSLQRVAETFQALRPELVVVTGGYAGAPSGALAALRGVPLVLQEQNSVPGVTTKVLSLFARQVHAAFPEAKARLPRPARSHFVLNGNPIRPPQPVSSLEARTLFGLPTEGPVMLVVGGSQGSFVLNQTVLDAVRQVAQGALPRAGLALLWSTGPSHFDAVSAELAKVGSPAWVRAVPYIDRMDAALSATDLAVSRAGAMATSEFLAWGIPSILVPLPTAAADHQTENAKSLEAAGAALYLAQATLDGAKLWTAVLAMAGDADALAARKKAALAIARPDAAHRIALALATLLPAPSHAMTRGSESRGAAT
jgi:UDP-N-acetylglucosamine--N-acetylmuramyl-(pentapeptide) pyrophosphoryl-undecaprenol N-acetylglucosamine transferase